MTEIPFDEFVSKLPLSNFRPRHAARSRLRVAATPEPFVKPSLSLQAGSEALSSEVIFVEASAAVGKTTIANYLSATLGAPILDLSAVPVSTGSLRTLLLDLENGADEPLAAFHAGRLPIIVDALDEGRLLSGETGFESFIETTGELLLQDRAVVNRPKLLFFGRLESTGLARMLIEMYSAGVTVGSVCVGFFGNSEAWELVDAYARSSAAATRSGASNSAYIRHPEPARQVIQAYFDAIETALGRLCAGIGCRRIVARENG